jgi:hypothetical protein
LRYKLSGVNGHVKEVVPEDGLRKHHHAELFVQKNKPKLEKQKKP